MMFYQYIWYHLYLFDNFLIGLVFYIGMIELELELVSSLSNRSGI